MGALRVVATVLPDGFDVSLWTYADVLTTTPQPDAEDMPGRYVLPGLVDAHAHVTIDVRGDAPARASDAVIAANLKAQRDAGVLLVRDIGRIRDEPLSLAGDDPDVVEAGRFLAPENGWVPGLHLATPPERLLDTVRGQLASGVRWVKVIGDWSYDGEIRVNYEPQMLCDVADLVHANGARLAVHALGPDAAEDAVVAGADSIEHGCFIDPDYLPVMAGHGTAWTPTLSAVTKPGGDPRRLADRIDAMRANLPRAVALGVPVLAGTDTIPHGSVANEVALLVEFGLDPVDALRAATTTARSFLGAPGFEPGAPADFVTYDSDPRSDIGVLRHPIAVVHRGVRIR